MSTVKDTAARSVLMSGWTKIKRENCNKLQKSLVAGGSRGVKAWSGMKKLRKS